MVIAKGAGRVSEVSARFTLDALPGKQMAIDADLAAGILTAEDARARRAEVAREADFYGSMDGASKFVKGDAVAGILILLINIIGGLIIGTSTHGLSFEDAANIYLLLSVGDALVAQIPALLLSIAAAILVTRTTDDNRLAVQVRTQFSSAGAWWPAAGILAMLAFVPAMPAAILLPAAAVAGAIGWRLSRTPPPPPPTPDRSPTDPNIAWSEVGEPAAVTLDIGYGLIGLVDDGDNGGLMGRVTAIRRQLSRDLGFVMPMVRVRDDVTLSPHAYRISLAGEPLGLGEAFASALLALEAEAISAEIPGRATREPAFGLPARWIDPSLESEALAAGYTVVDAATVIGTHLNKLMTDHAAQLFGPDEAHALVEQLRARSPQLAQSISEKVLPLPVLTAVLRALLEEGIPLKEFPRIAQALGEVAGRSQEPAELVELLRPAIGGLITAPLAPPGVPLRLVALAPGLESLLVQAVQVAPQAPFPFEPGLAARLVDSVRDACAPLLAQGTPVALVSQPGPRRALWRLLRANAVPIPVLGFAELPDSRPIEVAAVVGEAAVETPVAA
jgi:flagellar biosynthesis protein FlhA